MTIDLFPLIAALVVLAAAAWRNRSHLEQRDASLVGRTVVLHTQDDKTYRGIVHGVYEDSIALRHVMLIRGETERALGHEIRLRWGNVSSTQVVLAVREVGT